MKIKDVRPESFTKQIRCDRCGRLFEFGDMEFNESVSIDLKAGYGSVFGDGNDVQIDLCQHCLKLTLGRWLRIVEPGQQTRAVERFLYLLDPEQQGGELRTAADSSFVKPEDLPVQEPQSIDAKPSTSNRQTSTMTITITVESEKEEDGRWISEVSEFPGAIAYGSTRELSQAKAETLALRILADQLDGDHLQRS